MITNARVSIVYIAVPLLYGQKVRKDIVTTNRKYPPKGIIDIMSIGGTYYQCHVPKSKATSRKGDQKDKVPLVQLKIHKIQVASDFCAIEYGQSNLSFRNHPALLQ